MSCAAAALIAVSLAVGEQREGALSSLAFRLAAGRRRRLQGAQLPLGGTSSRAIHPAFYPFPEGKPACCAHKKTTRQSEKSDFSLGNAFFLQ
jgi:hypothetical protein